MGCGASDQLTHNLAAGHQLKQLTHNLAPIHQLKRRSGVTDLFLADVTIFC